MSILSQKLSGTMLIFLGAFFWSINAPIIKFLSINPLLICGLRSLISAIVLFIFIRPSKINLTKWAVIYSLSYSALSFGIIQSLSLTSSPIAIGMQYTAAIWLFFINWIIKKYFSFKRFLPVLIIMVGVIFFMNAESDSTSTLGNWIAFTEGIFFTLMTLSAKKSINLSPMELTATANLICGILMIIFFPSVMITAFNITSVDWLLVFILGTIQVGLGYCCYNAGVIKTTPQKASITALWEMILGPAWVALLLHEYPNITVFIGLITILIGMILDASLRDRNFEN